MGAVSHGHDGPESSGRSTDGSMARNSTLVAAGIFLSRIAGLVRESVTGYFLGTGVGAEAFRAALRIPNLLQNLLGEGVLSASFIPVYSKALHEGRFKDAGRIAGGVAGILLAVTSALVLVGVVFAEPITRVLVPGFVPGTARFDLTVTLVRIFAPGAGFLVLSAWCLGVLNAHRKFFLSYVAPVVWNVAIIAALSGAALWFTSDEVALAQALAWGAFGGSILQMAVQLPAVLRHSGHLRLSLGRSNAEVGLVLRRFGQVVAGRGGIQLAGYLDLVVASLLAFGAVSALGYAQVLYLLPISLFGMSVAASELPELSTFDHGNRQGLVRRLDAGLSRVAFFVLPSMIALVLVGDHIIATIYQGRNFSADASAQTGLVLAAYALGLMASTSSRLLQSALYGVGDARTPAIYGIIRVVVSLLFGFAIMFPLDGLEMTADGLRVAGDVGWSFTSEGLREGSASFFRLGAVGLALGAAIGAWVEWTLLRLRINVLFGRVRIGGGRTNTLVKAAIPTVLMALLARVLIAALNLPARLNGIVAIAMIGTTFLVAGYLGGLTQAHQLFGLTRRLRRR